MSVLLVPQEIRAQTDFYKGKTIRVVAATQPGGTSDTRIRAMLPFLEKYILGNRTIEIARGGSRCP
jgi:tripartite-type tricarboxylate transporter receptor subunit TctC